MRKSRFAGSAAGFCLAMLLFAASAGANHSLIELSSTSPTAANPAPYNAFLGALSADGSHVFFTTNEPLVPEDTDNAISLYQRYNGVTSLIGPWPNARMGVSPDGTRVVANVGYGGPIYEYYNGTATLVSTGPRSDGCLSACSWYFRDMTPDAQHVFFTTNQSLVLDDTDGAACGIGCKDLYERDLQTNTTTLISIGPNGGNGAFNADAPEVQSGGAMDDEVVSADGRRVFFVTQEKLVTGDLDNQIDVYVRDLQTNTTDLVSTGPNGGNGDFSVGFLGASADGTRVFFGTREALVSGDLDLCGGVGCYDIYARDVVSGTTTQVSTGPIGGAGPYDAMANSNYGAFWHSEDGRWGVFETAEPLVSTDADTTIDVYAHDLDNDATELASTWPTDAGGDARFMGLSPNGVHVYFRGDQLYDRNLISDTTTTLSVGPAGSGFPPFGEQVRSSYDGDRVFFFTSFPLVSEDTDANEDLYEWFRGGVTLLSIGPSGGNGGYSTAGPERVSRDGTRVAFLTTEPLAPPDVDQRYDVYTRSVAYGTPASAPSVDVALVPAFRQCGTGGNPANASHSPPLGVSSCDPPRPGSTVAVFGPQAIASAQLATVPGDPGTIGNEADVSIHASMSDVQGATGQDYDPNAAGADLKLVERLRITDLGNCTPLPCGGPYDVPATTTDLDFSVQFACTPSPSASIGSNCATSTTANAVMPGAIVESRSSVLQSFRVRVDDAGANGVPGDSDDRIFSTQGVFAP